MKGRVHTSFLVDKPRVYIILERQGGMIDFFLRAKLQAKLGRSTWTPMPMGLCRMLDRFAVFHWVVVYINDLVQISCDQLCNLSQLVEIEEPAGINLATLRRTY